MTGIMIDTTAHTMTRVNIHTGIPFDEFCTALEKAAPVYDPVAFEGAATWDAVVDAMADFAPYDLITYARLDTRAMLALTDTREQAIEYLIGNHTIAATMSRHDVNALLYAPLRVLVYTDDAGDAVFAIDRPSTVFAGLGNEAIAETGRLLDAKVTGLLEAIGMESDLNYGDGHDQLR